MKDFINNKIFHVCMVITIIVVILFIAGILILKYSIEGEKNLPFNLSKIVIVSTSEGIDKEDKENKWAFDINQNNDIYLYIEKNKYYTKTETIENVKIDNIVINRNSEIGTEKIYKPSTEEKVIFKNVEENEISNIEYIGDIESDIKQTKISNQGGLVLFRYSLNGIGEYLSNNDEEINHNDLLKKINIKNEDLKSNITFDLTIELNSGKKYKAELSLEFPKENIIEKATVSQEITDLNNIVFKRIENI